MHNENSKNIISIPGAILVAGLMVALAIVFTSVPSDGSTVLSNNNSEGDTKVVNSKALASSYKISSKVEKCVAEENSSARKNVDADMQDGINAGVGGTPHTLLVHKDGTVVAQSGAAAAETFSKNIDKLLSGDTSGFPDSNISFEPVSGSEHIRGNKNADVFMIEYSDIDCPFCQRIHPVLDSLVEKYDGKVAWVYRHFPLTSLHPNAYGKAVTSECISQIDGEDEFWKYLDSELAV